MRDLYKLFQKNVQEKNFLELDAFQEKSFWQTLNESEKKELALLFLKKAEHHLSSNDQLEEPFFQSLAIAEEIGSAHPYILCHVALFLFRYGMFQQKGHFFLQALEKLTLCEQMDPIFLGKDLQWMHLWGNVLVALSRVLRDDYFLEKALKKYEQAEKLLPISHPLALEIYWDSAEAWILLSRYSGELTDLKKGIDKYQMAVNLGHSLPHLRIDYAVALTDFGILKGDPDLIEEALSFFCGIIADTYQPEKEPTEAYRKAWVGYALAAKARFFLSHRNEHLELANTIFREAVLNVADHADLWLHWGELFLHSGLLSSHLSDIETGLEKLTSSKIKECDPLKVSALLGLGLIILGNLLEDLKLLQDGKARIQAALEIAPEHSLLQFAAGFVEVYLGLYFSDSQCFKKAISYFEKNLENEATQVENWYGLYQAYLGQGITEKNPSSLKKAIRAISRLSELRPFSAIYLNEWGIALLKLRQIDLSKSCHQELIEEAVEVFKKGWALNEDEEILFNLACALDLLAEITSNEEDYEEAIEILTKIYEKRPSSQSVRYHLAIILSHLGELTSDVENLNRSIEFFDSISEAQAENEEFWCDFGYALLNLSELIYDPIDIQRGQELRRDAEKKLIKAAELGSALACYHLACLYSLCELNDASMHYLQRAETLDSLPSIEDLEHDEWLSGIRNTEAFREFLMTHKSTIKNSEKDN